MPQVGIFHRNFLIFAKKKLFVGKRREHAISFLDLAFVAEKRPILMVELIKFVARLNRLIAIMTGKSFRSAMRRSMVSTTPGRRSAEAPCRRGAWKPGAAVRSTR